MIRPVKIIALLCFLLVAATWFVDSGTAQAQDPEIGSDLPKFSNPFDNPNLAVTIPGLTFRDVECEPSELGEDCYVPWLADYIQALYVYGIGLIAVLAVVAMMVAGVIWLTAGGNTQRISEAKQWINGGLMGVVIAFSSYLILNMVNPALTELSPIKISTIEEVDLDPYVENDTIDAPNSPPGQTSYPAVDGQCFPVAANSFKYISWNFAADRGGGKRNHAAIDIYTKFPEDVVAIAPGKVVNIYRFYKCKSSGRRAGIMTYAIIVDHGDYVVNYGEIDFDRIYVKVGQQINAGTRIGGAAGCGMLHFELYTKGTTQNTSWPKSQPKPANLMDPTETIKSLQSKMCGN